MIAEFARWPLTSALLASWRRDDAAASLDVLEVVGALAAGEASAELGWTVEIGAKFPLAMCAQFLVVKALRAGA